MSRSAITMHFTLTCLILAALTSCITSPAQKRPEMAIPAAFKEGGPWKVAQPSDHLSRGKWWVCYHDAQLNALEEKIEVSNQTLASAAAKAAQARALVRNARSAYFPNLNGSASATRSKSSSSSGNIESTSLDLGWEIDLWGRIRHTVSSAQASAEAGESEVESTRLSLQAQLAQNYFALRIVDAQRRLLDGEIASYEKSLELTKNRYAAGVAARQDVAQAEAQLAATRVSAIDTGVQRTQLEHAIAVLLGLTPAAFTLPPRAENLGVPKVPVSAPSKWLERRPDIAAAERRVASANQQVGAARAAYFPALTLSATGGFRGMADLISVPNRFWSLGPALTAPLFDGGLRKSQVEQARALYDQNVADYRQTVLTGFQEVEDNLAALRILEQEAAAQAGAVRAARESEKIALNEYKAGTANYLSVIIAEAAALTNERAALDVLGRRLSASVLLVKALGGGW